MGFSKSEQYAESRPREGGVFADRSREMGDEREGAGLCRGMLSLAEEEYVGWRGPQLFSVIGGGGWRTISWGISLRLREKRFRKEDRWRTSGAGAACSIGA